MYRRLTGKLSRDSVVIHNDEIFRSPMMSWDILFMIKDTFLHLSATMSKKDVLIQCW